MQYWVSQPESPVDAWVLGDWVTGSLAEVHVGKDLGPAQGRHFRERLYTVRATSESQFCVWVAKP